MADWNKKQVEPSAINGGKEFTVDDDLSVKELNAIVNNSLYASEVAKRVDESLNDVVKEKGTIVYEGETPLATLVFNSNPQEQINAISEGVQRVQGYISNPNLLINGDFRINQRGQTSYSEGNKYTIDRWLNRENSLSVTPLANGGVKLERTANASTSVSMISQSIEHFENLLGKTLTITFKIREDNTVNGFWFGVWGGNETRYASKEYGGTQGFVSGTGIISRTFIMPESIDYTRLNVTIRLNGANSSQGENIIIDWAKLEIGEVSTAFIPRPYAEELALCQRYCVINNDYDYTYNDFGIGVAGKTTQVDIKTSVPVVLRTPPTIQYIVNNGSVSTSIPANLKLLTYTGGSLKLTSTPTSVVFARQNASEIMIRAQTTVNIGSVYSLYIDGGDKIKVILDAEIY